MQPVRAAWQWLGHISLIQWIFSLFGGSFVSALAFMNSQPLWLVLFVGLGAAAIILILFERAGPLGGVRRGDWDALKDILERADPRIPGMLRAGHTRIETRIAEVDYADLVRFKQTPGGMKVIAGLSILDQIRGSLLANGSLGPTIALPLQYRIALTLNEAHPDG